MNQTGLQKAPLGLNPLMIRLKHNNLLEMNHTKENENFTRGKDDFEQPLTFVL